MAFWRRHKWENKGIMEKGTILASGFDPEIGKDTNIVTKSDFIKWQCARCGECIHIIGKGPSPLPRFGCDKKTLAVAFGR